MFRPGRILVLGALAALLIPPVVFLAAALGAGLSAGESVAALVEQYVAPRQNLLVTSAIGLVPLALLGAVLWTHRRFAPQSPARPILAVAGLVPILAVLAWIHQDFWQLFLPSRTYPGFPHGLGFVIGPLAFAPAGMALSMLAAWLFLRFGPK